MKGTLIVQSLFTCSILMTGHLARSVCISRIYMLWNKEEKTHWKPSGAKVAEELHRGFPHLHHDLLVFGVFELKYFCWGKLGQKDTSQSSMTWPKTSTNLHLQFQVWDSILFLFDIFVPLCRNLEHDKMSIVPHKWMTWNHTWGSNE